MSDKPDMMDAKPEAKRRKGAILITTANDPTAEQVILLLLILQLLPSRCIKRCFTFSVLLH